MDSHAVLFEPSRLAGMVKVDGRTSAIMELVDLPREPEDIYALLSTAERHVRRFSSIKDPTRRTIAYFASDLVVERTRSWVLPAFHNEPIPGPVLVCALNDHGEHEEIRGAIGEEWYGTIMGADRVQWSRAKGVQVLPQRALDHWIMTIPRLRHLTYMLD